MRIPTSLALLSSLLLSALTTIAGPLKDTYWLQDRGTLSKFEVARDELHVAGVRRFVQVQAAAEDLRKVVPASEPSELILYPAGAAHSDENRRFLQKEIAVELARGADINTVSAVGVAVIKSVGRERRLWIVESGPELGSALEAAEKLRRLPGVLSVEPQLARQQQKRATTPNDPLFSQQWHLNNTGQGGGEPDIDINVRSVWDSYRGQGVVIGIVDDGLEKSHPDLAPNYNAALSHDFNFNDNDPSPGIFDDHGTSCAGVAAAKGNNGIGVTGAAFDASLAGLRLISRPTSDRDEAEAFEFHIQEIDIKSNSWGPFDNARILDRPGALTRAAFEDAVETGRGGLGTVIVWAGGNGLGFGDDSNYDGYANAPETIAVGAIGDDGEQAFYSENGANLVVTAPSSGGPLGICTTDRKGRAGYNDGRSSFNVRDSDYTNNFGGTSSACPLVAGCVALILEANPDLGWRDVQEILMASATKVNSFESAWSTNSGGFHFNEKYGAGLINVGAAVTMAEGWQNLGPRVSIHRGESFTKLIIPDNEASTVEKSYTFNETVRVEHVVVTVDIRHSSRGQIDIELESPSGMISHIAPARLPDRHKNYNNWQFMSVRHWGESAAGTWKVRIRDTQRRVVGTLKSVDIEIFGTQP